MCHNMYYSYFILCCFIIFKIISAGEVGDKCAPTEEISEGTCKLMTDCKVAISFIQATQFHPFSRCGFNLLEEIVCCPHIHIEPLTTRVTGNGARIADRECQKIVDTTIPPLNSHIIHGKDALLGEFPYQVSLGYNITGKLEFRCGGSLISDTYVLTAAHCVDTMDRVLPSIARMGVIDISDDDWNSDSDVRIQQIIKHPDFVRKMKYFDIALLKLEQAVRFKPSLNPICLYTKNDDPAVNLTISGWGTTDLTRQLATPYLQKATVFIVSKSICRNTHPPSRRLMQGISDSQICAGNLNGPEDTCQGDSGGPLQGLTHDDGFPRLVGVTSYGRGCGSSLPAVYTRVSSFLDWIESVVWPNERV